MINSGLRLVETDGVDKKKALDAAISQIDKAFGKGSLMKLGDREVVDIEAISTGSLGLDIALGIGGLPKGRIIEITVRKAPVKRHSLCSASRQLRRKAALRPLLMLNMHSTQSMPPSLALTSMSF